MYVLAKVGGAVTVALALTAAPAAASTAAGPTMQGPHHYGYVCPNLGVSGSNVDGQGCKTFGNAPEWDRVSNAVIRFADKGGPVFRCAVVFAQVPDVWGTGCVPEKTH
ncbi:hypothetical protein [Streptomyces sp. NPDC046939]|uniref:hypothetical protein n=1 Tax=Streptomyces sp. NPDC046939 TaxID=3155376 RepID=UPI0033C60C20